MDNLSVLDFTVLIDPKEITREDSGTALYVDLDPDPSSGRGLWMTLRSSEEFGAEHPEFSALVGKRVRVRVELIDEDA